MAQEFFTVRGKIVLERDKLFLRSLIPTPFSETVLFRVALGLVALMLFVNCFFIEDPWSRYTKLVLSVFFLGRWVMPLFKLVTKTSLANRIPLDRIAAYSLHTEPHGLETVLTLHLQNGRTREIVFRSREKEVEAFAQLLQANGIVLKGGGEERELLPA